MAEYSVGRSYRTVNVARSAVVNPGNVVVGVDSLVNKLLKGLYNKSPPTARYSQIWNPDTVLSHFDATAGAALSLLELSRKLDVHAVLPQGGGQCSVLSNEFYKNNCKIGIIYKNEKRDRTASNFF